MKDDIFAKWCLTVVAFICITAAAMRFDNASLLWWYLLPALISIN